MSSSAGVNMNVPDDQLLVIMTVDLGNARADEIEIRYGDRPEDLAAEFVRRNELDPETVIAEDGPTGRPLRLLETLIEHVAQNKETALQRARTAASQQETDADGHDVEPAPEAVATDDHHDQHDEDDITFDDDDSLPLGADEALARTADAMTRHPPTHSGPGVVDDSLAVEPADSPDNPGSNWWDNADDDDDHNGRDEDAEDSAAVAVPTDAEDGELSSSYNHSAPHSHSHSHHHATTTEDEGEDAVDDDDVVDAARSVSPASVASSRRLAPTEDEREREYMALRASIASRNTPAARGGRRKRRGGGSSRRSTTSTTSTRSTKAPIVPRVATLKPRQSPPPEDDFSSRASTTSARTRRTDGAVFNRLYHEAELRKEKAAEREREAAMVMRTKYKQFMDPMMGGESYLDTHQRGAAAAPVAVSPGAQLGVRLYEAGMAAKAKHKEKAAAMKLQLAERADWVCPICTGTNSGLDKHCQNIVKSGKEVVTTSRRPPMSRSGGRPASPPRSASLDSTQMLDEHGNLSPESHPPPRQLALARPSSLSSSPPHNAPIGGEPPEPPSVLRRCGTPKPAPFRPTISSDAHEIRYNKDHLKAFSARQESLARQKEALAKEVHAKALKECTFRPKINTKSAALVADRRRAADPAAVTVNIDPHDRLYNAARRSQAAQRLRELNANSAEKLTFTPEVNRRTIRLAPDTKVYERLYEEKDRKAERLERLAKDAEKKDWMTGETLFKPKTGRGPTVPRNTHGLDIGEFLFRSRHHTEDLRAVLTEEREMEEAELRSARFTNPTSDRMVNELRDRAFARIFRRLKRSEGLTDLQKALIKRRQVRRAGRALSKKSASASSTSLGLDASAADPSSADALELSLDQLAFGEGGDDDILDDDDAFDSDDTEPDEPKPEPVGTVCLEDVFPGVLHPEVASTVAAALSDSGSRGVGFREFAVLMQAECERSRNGPRIYPLTKSSRVDKTRRELRARELAANTFRPEIDRKSAQMYDNLVTEDGRGLPVHARLYHRAETYNEHKKMLKEQFAKEEVQDCTFKPKLNKAKRDHDVSYPRMSNVSLMSVAESSAADGSTAPVASIRGGKHGAKKGKPSGGGRGSRKAGAGGGRSKGRGTTGRGSLDLSNAVPSPISQAMSPSIISATDEASWLQSSQPTNRPLQFSDVEISPEKRDPEPQPHAAPHQPPSPSVFAGVTASALMTPNTRAQTRSLSPAARATEPAPVVAAPVAPATASIALTPAAAAAPVSATATEPAAAAAAPVASAAAPAVTAAVPTPAPVITPAPPQPRPARSNKKKKASLEDRIQKLLHKGQ